MPTSRRETASRASQPVNDLLRVSLSADYAGRPNVLKGVELELRRAEILALVGQSGSGKSTIALAILGLLGMRGEWPASRRAA